jgi:hypothetical protein
MEESSHLFRRGAAMPSAVALILVALAFLTPTASASAAPFVENARAVTGGLDPSRIYATPAVAVDPNNPSTVALVAGNYHYPGGCNLYVSQNGGLSWGPGVSLLPASSGTQFCLDRPISGRYAAPLFASNGALYVGFGAAPGGQDFPNNQSSAYFAKSTDLGLTISTAAVSPTHMVMGMGMGGGGMAMGAKGGSSMKGVSGMSQARGVGVAADPSNANTVYMGWDYTTTVPKGYTGSVGCCYSVLGAEHTAIAVSHDGGRTWGAPLDLTATQGKTVLASGFGSEAPTVVTTPSGAMLAITDSTVPSGVSKPNQFVMYKSTNGGSSWKASIIPFTTSKPYQFISSPEAAVDRKTGEIYVTADVQYGKPGTFVGANTVYVIHSTDDGQTWSAPAIVVDPAIVGIYDQYDPGISVAPNGRVDIAWIDFRSDPYYKLAPSGKPASGSSSGERYYDIYATYSTDHGATWAKNIRVSNNTIDGSLGAEFPDFAVAPVGVASTNNQMFVTWGNPVAGAPPATPEDAFFTAVNFSAPAAVGTTASSSSTGTNVLWAIIGAALALMLAGLILVGRQRQADSRSLESEKEKVGSGSGSSSSSG